MVTQHFSRVFSGITSFALKVRVPAYFHGHYSRCIEHSNTIWWNKFLTTKHGFSAWSLPPLAVHFHLHPLFHSCYDSHCWGTPLTVLVFTAWFPETFSKHWWMSMDAIFFHMEEFSDTPLFIHTFLSDCPSGASVTWQQNTMEYYQEYSTAITPTSVSDFLGQHHKIRGITIGAALVYTHLFISFCLL